MNDPLPTCDEAPCFSAESSPQPDRIGRYRIEALLGRGGFGRVYLAHDEQLSRLVALKVPHAHLVSQAADAEVYLTEARTVASLDHPNIVPVFDVGSTDLFPCFIVSKYIDGIDLASRLKHSRLPLHEAVELTATVAEALHHAHKQVLVHRDIKPGNILLDRIGKPFVADFGLALREQDIGKGPRYAGTPAYMSPEQARGEGHRVDGRSDIFSLGVVLYELLTGRRPFRAGSPEEVRKQIIKVDARPCRQLDDRIPKELDRICLKALSKRSSERYSTAKDMADDLRHYLAGAPVAEMSAVGREGRAANTAAALPSPVPTPSDQQAFKIVPKGLRSFDALDADFFLELLPGARDRDGLPESIRFWKSRIEASDRASTFSVGLIYGPSGCGKSSLVKAALLPTLAKSVTAVYVEAAALDTETRLLQTLRRQVADLPGNLDLVESLAALRQGRFLEAGQKVLLVLDQFEQWLHAKQSEEATELVEALRHCDSARVQCIVLVRDDFWLAVSRFMQALEIRVLEGENSRLVDLFDPRHARKVLTAFGRAFRALPEHEKGLAKETFLDQAVADLAENGKVVCIRLALFAEMVKGKPWTPATLEELGGTEGIGVTFLEETFSASTAAPERRYHQQAARSVLKVLLPEPGTDIKGHLRSQQDLLEASGYAGRPKDFDELLRILDGELRLLTPTDPEGKQESSVSGLSPDAKYYQLTHDYLVPSLRDWLTRKQKETRRGRMELLLADRAAVWRARPENRQLPSLLQWFQFWWLTQSKRWTPPQQKMMRHAAHYHALRAFAVAVLSALIGWGGCQANSSLQARALRDRLLVANTSEVPPIVRDMALYRRWLNPLLHEARAQAEKDDDRRKQLHISLALLPVDASQVTYLTGRLLTAEAAEVPVIRDALAPHKGELVEQLWAVAEAPGHGTGSQRLAAAAALATYDPGSQRWAKVREALANDLVTVPPVYLASWLESFRPVRAQLLLPLAVIFRDTGRRDAERSLAAAILADYAADGPQVLAALLLYADDKQFTMIFPKVKEQAEQALPLFRAELDRTLPVNVPSSDERRELLAKRQANAGLALLKMNQPREVWPLLKQSSDPRLRSYLIHRLAPFGADAGAIIQRLDEEVDVTIRRALLLSLGEFDEKALPPGARHALLPKVQDMYRTASDPGIHGSAEWLLRAWRQKPWLKKVNDEWAEDKSQREKRLQDIQQSLQKASRAASAPGVGPQWYVNSQGQTMVVIPGPVEFVMGAPPEEAGAGNEPLHKRRINRTFVIAATPVTLKQYGAYYKLQFGTDYEYVQEAAPSEDCPVHGTDWYMAAAYCNWLSDQEGIPSEHWCYETDGRSRVTKLKPNYLRLTGYRLPTEAEMEYATRAGALTSRYYGETEELLGQYAWYLLNSNNRSLPVGTKKPNDFGLFDLHGNVHCWCQTRFQEYPNTRENEVLNDMEDSLDVDSTDTLVLRGGSFTNLALNVRSAVRDGVVRKFRNRTVGFRPGRTVTP